MQEQERNKSSGMKATVQDQKKQKSSSFPEQRKGISLHDEAKNFLQHPKNARVHFASDAERNLDGERYRLGDMVWAKVKSHPWWPGQLYDPKLASASALELKRDSCFLVAFFGDSTFGWFAEAELIPFAPNFAQKSKQTSAHNFVDAVEDALDEVRRRVKVGLTCGCCISDSASDDERNPGLLYDRQLCDIRRTFKPAVLFALVKDLACSPMSSSLNTLGNAVARAQADAFRLQVSSRNASEHGERQVLSDFVPTHQLKGQALNDTGRPGKSKDKYKADKAIRKKHVPVVQAHFQEPKELSRGNSTTEKLGGLAKVGKGKQRSMSSSADKGSTQKSKNFNEEEGSVKGINAKSKGSMPAKDGVRESRTLDATVSNETVASADAFEERDLVGSCGQKATLPGSFDATAVLDEALKNDLSFLVSDSLASDEVKATQTKPGRDLGGPSKKKIVKVSKVDATKFQALSIKPTSVAMNMKATDAAVGQLSKKKVLKKAKTVNVAMEQVDKTVKDADGGGLETKRMAYHDAIEGCDTFPAKVKKRKVSLTLVGNDESDRSLKESVVCSSASDDKMQQGAEEIMSDYNCFESDPRQPIVELLVPMEVTEDVSAAPLTSELDSDVNRLHQGETLQLAPPVSDDALAPVVSGPQLDKQEDQLEVDQMAMPSPQAKSSADVSEKKKKKLKDSRTIEVEASAPFVSDEWPLKQEQSDAELREMSPLQVKDPTEITPKTKKKSKNKLSVQPVRPDVDDALLSLANRLKQGDTIAAEHRVESSLQGKNLMDISKKKKKKWKDPSTFEPHNIDGNSNCLVVGDGKDNAKCMETFSIVVEDQISESLLPPWLEADSRLMDTGGIGSSFVGSGAVDARKDIRQTKKETPAVKHGQEGKKASKSVKEVKVSKSLPSLNRVTLSNKRVLEEKEDFLKNSRPKGKKVKVVVLENSFKSCERRQGEDGTEQYEDLTKNRKESGHTLDLHEGSMSVFTKPPGFSKEEVHSVSMMDFTDSTKAGLCQGPENLLASEKDANMVVPEAGNNRNGWESPKILEAAREQAKASFKIGRDHTINAEGSKVEDVRIEKEGEQDISGEGWPSGQYNINTPSKLSKKSVSISKKTLSSSISLRPAIDVTIPVRCSKEVLNRFGQRVPRQADEVQRLGSHPSRSKNATVERVLMISFPKGSPLPSELELTEVFAKFGDLNRPLTRIDFRSGCARIIFRRAQDAEGALHCMRKTPVYENARFWLKPRDGDVGGISKQSSKYTESWPALCHSDKLEANTGSDICGRSVLDKRVSTSLENDTAVDRYQQEKVDILHNFAFGKAGGAPTQECGARDAQLSQNAGAPDKIFTANTNNSGHESLEAAAPSLSHLPGVGPSSLGIPAASIDISESFLALLHELHDLVLSIGFKF